MVLLDRWDIGLVPSPFTDHNAVKKRAAFALTNISFNRATNVTVFAMITKAEFSVWPGDYTLTDWKTAGLRLPSVVRMKCFSIENSLILKRLGRLEPSDINGVQASAKQAFE